MGQYLPQISHDIPERPRVSRKIKVEGGSDSTVKSDDDIYLRHLSSFCSSFPTTTVTTTSTTRYDCWFMGRNRLFRITGCYVPLLEIKDWSNVACTRRTDPLFWVLEESRVWARDVIPGPEPESIW